MNKKVYFYQVNLKDVENDIERDYKDIKNIFISIIEENAVDYKGMKVLNLTRNEEFHYFADIFQYKEDMLFMRIGSQKPSGTFLYRNYATNIPESVLEGTSEDMEGIEIYTYALFDYNTAILSLVGHKGAPSYKLINNICMCYKPSYGLRFVQIPNAAGIEKIYGADNSSISQIEVEVPVPAPEILERMFNWSDIEILNAQENSIKATIRLSAIDRKFITHDETQTRGLIDSIRRKLPNYNKASVRGKYPGERMQDYSFLDEYFYYIIDVPMYKTINGEKQYFSADELINVYQDKLYSAYYNKKDILISITNRW